MNRRDKKPFGLPSGLRLLLGLWAITLGASACAQTPVSSLPVIAGPPEVLIIVYQQPGSADQVDVTYARTVPHAQALQDSRALTQAGGWPVSALTLRDAAGPIRTRPTQMTSVVFQALGVVQNSTHTFPVETFARAFHSYKRLNIVFFVGPQFQFQGSRSYADNDIKMVLDQRNSSYTYQVEIANSNFGRLPLAPSATGAQATVGHQSPGKTVAFILGAAAAAGLLVYFLTARLASKPEAAPGDSSDTEETQLEVGTKR